MSKPHPEQHNRRSSTSDGSSSVRWRLWAAMLALALVPTIAGIYLVTSPLDSPDAALSAERTRETTESAAGLLAREQAIEARLLVAAADPAMVRLANGINGANDKQLATRVLSALRASDGSIITGACIVRSPDGKRIPLVSSRARTCANNALRHRAIGASAGTVTRTTTGDGEAQRLLIASPLRSVNGRFSGVLSAEVDVAALFDRARMLGGNTVSSMLVDMGSSEVVATAAASAGSVDGARPVTPAAVVPYLSGVVAHNDDANRDVSAMGLLPTVVPLWSNGDGTSMGLVQLWPEPARVMPFGTRLALMLMLTGAIIGVIVLVRYFLSPFEEMADSRNKLQTLYREAREDAMADGLTGLGNHRAFQEELGRQVEASEMRGAPFTLVLMDLDDLKLVNDRDGHATGDEMLVSMARSMRDLARADDLLFRTGGDEFAIILPHTDIEDGVEVAERILHFCKRPPLGGRPSPFSAGVSGVPRFARQRDTVYRQADAALYWAKRNYRGTVEVFEPQRDMLTDVLTDDTAKANAVAEVVTGKLLRPVFQPIVDLRTGRVLGFEGLIRPDPKGPLPDTSQLFAAAAASGRTVDLDLACIETLVNAASAIGPDRLLTLNLSPRTLETKDFDAAWLLSSLVRNGISPSRVIIELTEREEVNDIGRLQQTFNLLQQYGLRLAADDVGAGNSGLRLLSQIQFDIVKIDLALVQSGVRHTGARAVLESLRDLALSQNARIIAEGVETARQLQVIRELDLGAAQGFLLGRPDASLDKTFVDVHQLEIGVVEPAMEPKLVTPHAGAVAQDEVGEIADDRRAIFLPPAAHVFRPNPGGA
jgi:diguanylate cyclase (GGDEF)-like protein